MPIWAMRHISAASSWPKKLDIKNGGMIDKTKFKGRIVAMFEKMDSNGDGSLNDKEINKMKRHHYSKMKNKTGGYSN